MSATDNNPKAVATADENIAAGKIPKIKMCGLSREEDIRVANRIRPDYIGFVFAPGSKRRVTPEVAATLKQQLQPGITAVGVFVDEPPEQVAALLQAGTIDMAQLHGHEDEAYMKQLRALTNRPLIQAFRIREEADLKRALESSADYLLLDGGAGDGKTFDWSLLAAGAKGRPFFLAGGLHPDNVAEAIRAVQPYGVDVSSGIEMADETGKATGVKDPLAMERFAETVRNNTINHIIKE